VDCDEKFRPVLRFLLGRTFYVGETLFEEGILRGGAEPLAESYQATPADLGRLVQELANLRQTLELSFAERTRLEKAIEERRAERGPLAEDERKMQVASHIQDESINRLREECQMNETEEKLIAREKAESFAAIQQAQEALKNEEVL